MKPAFVAALTLAALLGGPSSRSAAAEPAERADPAGRYDGTWSVQLVTQSGFCDASINAALVVTNGQVKAGEAGVNVSGQIGGGGAVSLALRKGPASGAASGTLAATSGSGTWNVSTLGCSGRWTAQRRPSQTAQAL